jgi:hypothetical protein
MSEITDEVTSEYGQPEMATQATTRSQLAIMRRDEA